jgi:L-histidine Nalpha-methyltransferase
LAWARACNDHLYLVMKKSIEFFPERWNKIKTDILEPYHYVSLGVGTGTKDRRILRDLSRLRRDFYYFPVDMSPEMLRVGLKACLESEDIPRCKMLPIQIDFSVESNIFEIQRMLQRIVGDEPILFSLLGNTLANFEEDNDLLETLQKLMRPQDRFLLEVATTALLDTISINSAADEYIKSSAFKQFVTSAILQYTDLPAGLETVDFLVAIEGEKAIKIKAVYTNREGRTLPLKLPDNTTVDFLPDDTIRLYLTRKYTIDGINKLIKDTGFFPISNQHELQSREGFGIDLFLLKKVDI